jgi:hypothetical protein
MRVLPAKVDRIISIRYFSRHFDSVIVILIVLFRITIETLWISSYAIPCFFFTSKLLLLLLGQLNFAM